MCKYMDKLPDCLINVLNMFTTFDIATHAHNQFLFISE